MIENTVILKVEDYKELIINNEKQQRKIENLTDDIHDLNEDVSELVTALAKELFGDYSVENAVNYIKKGEIKGAYEYLDTYTFINEKVPNAYIPNVRLLFKIEVDKKLAESKEVQE